MKALKKAPVKKTVPKKTTNINVAKKAVPKAKATSSVPVKKVTTKAAKKISKPKEKLNLKNVISSKTETVTIPTDAGIRLTQKAEAKRRLAFQILADPMYKIAYISAFCFMFVGVTAIASNYITFDGRYFSAATCLSTIDCDLSNNTNINTDLFTDSISGIESADIGTVNTADPTFKMLDIPPPTLIEDTKLNFSVINGIHVAANLLSTNDGGLYPLDLKQLSNQNYRVTINENSLPPGSYSLKVFVTKVDGTGTFSYPGGRFIVPSPEIDSTILPEEKDTFFANKEIKEETNIEIEALDEDVDFIQLKPIEVQSAFQIVLTNKIFSNREAIRLTAPDSYTNINLYIRAENAISARYLGSMTKEFDRWIYAFNSNNLPNATYELFATAVNGDNIETSPSQRVTVDNLTITSEPQRVIATNTEVITTESNRNFYLYEQSSSTESARQVHPSADAETEIIFENNLERVNSLLQRYAVAVQSGNSIMIEAASKEIDEEREKQVINSVLDPLTSAIASQIEQGLEKKYTDLKNRVKTFEKIRSSRDSSVSDDTDKDGISDFDEVNIYNTDPNNPDSDNDGFIDGAEIIGGFNPTNSSPEATLKYEMPQKVFGLERSDVLKIEKVIPLIETNESSQTYKVIAEIFGTGLPNSFVTIYVFSTPVIVTVKTDINGAFMYQLDKELEDGRHEIYVAFTDNSGSILAHSKAFEFVKEAQAFTPVDASENQIISAAPITEVAANEGYRLVLGMAVLALGFILLMLGINIRSNKQTQVEVAV